MTTIRATCPRCGDVRLASSDVTVRVCEDDGGSTYCFRCPGCDGTVAKDTTSEIADLLAWSGVRLDRWRRPAELDERRGGPPLTPDDLLDFHELLQRPDWFSKLHARPPATG
jgi:hypothetical protein